MVERLYIKEYLSFEEVDLEFRSGLVVFTGPSGAGKSLLINALLALFGLKPQEAALSEVTLEVDLQLDQYGLQEDELYVIRSIKKEKVRYFLSNQSISKRRLQEIFASKLAYLSPKDNDFFTSSNVIAMIEDFIKDEKFWQLRKELFSKWNKLIQLKRELSQIEEAQKRSEERKEFLAFEIQKIASIDPKEGEYEELMQIKKELSKKEKITEAIQRAQGIFEYEGYVSSALELLEVPSDFFDDVMNELREIFYSKLEHLQDLDEIDVEEVLKRIEDLSSLKRKYGSIEEAIKAKEEKEQELHRLENIDFEKESLQKEIPLLQKELESLAKELSKERKKVAKIFEKRINSYLAPLKLPHVELKFFQKELDESGIDGVQVQLQGVPFEKISSGEFNRLRLAFLAAWSDVGHSGGVLVLDEIDANVSGEESMAVARILKKLSKKYQIFAISHQAQLASLADQHFLIEKRDGKSYAKELNERERIDEIARIISGEKITEEAKEFAKKLRKEQC